jgi:carbon monoxide dehydrogenase subunit G
VIFDQRVTVPASIDDAWAFLMDIPAVSACVPGVESMVPDGDDRYNAAMKVKLGSIKISFEGTIIVVDRDRDALRAVLRAEGSDRRVGGAVKADVEMTLEPRSAHETDMVVHTDAAVLGKLGEFGQAVMRKKADQVMKQFGDNMAAALAGSNGDDTAAQPATESAPAPARPAAPAAAATPAATEASPEPQVAPAAASPVAARSSAAPVATRPSLLARIRAWFQARRARRG